MRIQLLYILFFLIGTNLFAQSSLGTLEGTLTSDQGELLSFATVRLREINTGTISDIRGKYKLQAKEGKYTIEVTYVGCEKFTAQVQIRRGATRKNDFVLKTTSFLIGSIEVVAKNDFLQNTPETKTSISAGEIEHIQASSLNDVLKLTPGVETTNPTLNSTEKAEIRNGDPIGTQIILDGIPITNNANMQIGIGQSSANSGIDLRAIPAENIKEVEVIRGIPSVQYGDLTDGILIVKTKSSVETPKLKMKYNPQLYESNLSAGFGLGSWVMNTNLNVASSSRDIRIEQDGYTRIALQSSLEKAADEYATKNVFYFTRAFDEYKEKPGYALREAWYNRDINVKYSGDHFIMLNELDKINLKLSVGYTYQNSYDQRLVSRDNLVLSTRLTEGTQEGRIVFGSYLGKKNIRGDVWNLYGDLNYLTRFYVASPLHNVLFGITYRNDFNKGEGIIFDPLFPPSVSVTTPRLRRYDMIPDYPILSLYLEDRVTGNIILPFTFSAGLRYEIFKPSGIDFGGLAGKKDFIKSQNGSFLNPRIAMSVSLTENTQLRLGYGVTAKSPPMGMIYAQERYYDVVDTVSVVNPQYPDSNFSLISTFIREQANRSIKGYTQKKYEVSLDQQWDFFGFTVTGYLNSSKDMFESVSQPNYYYKRSFPYWPADTGSLITRYYLDTYTRYGNKGYLDVKGIELSMGTKRIPVINTVIKLDASYMHTVAGSKDGYYFSSSRFVAALNEEVIPMYKDYESYNKEVLINYRFEIQSKELGMWLTLHIQQKPMDIDGRNGYDDTLATGYYSVTKGLVSIPEEQRPDAAYSAMTRHLQGFELLEEDRPNKWLVNLKVSKSLWKGAVISFYVNNFFNNRPLYRIQRSSAASPSYERRNPGIFYGLDFNTMIDL
ncbi:MAG: TonB-dependent receptor [Ignavibacteriaceae bacterium]|nr:TonB-dependent receptor [Ignavibacteriaceae bacterium]